MNKKIDFKKLEKPYLIAEIGANHNGDIQIAKKLIDATFACDWDICKFQKRNLSKCIPESQKNKLKETPWGNITYFEYRKKLEFNKEEYDAIDVYCSQKPLDWTASIWDEDSLYFIVENYQVPFIKIPSALLTDDDLIVKAAKTKKSLILSTGMSTLQEIDKSVNSILKHNNDLVILHCNSSYPTIDSELNLKCIPMFQERYGLPVGFSNHSDGLESIPIAISLGAMVIERHITLSHDMWGTDQKSSLEVHGMNMLRKRINNIPSMLGDGVKRITESELPIREKLRKQ